MARRLHIKVIEAVDLLNLDSDDQLDPYVLLSLKNQDKKYAERTEVKNNTNHPVWNQQFNMLTVDPNDVLVINIFNKGIKKDKKIMDEVQFPVNSFQILAPVERKLIDLKLKKKKNFLPAGRLIIEIQAYPPNEKKRDPNAQVDHVVLTEGCKVHIKCFDAKDVIKMGLGAKPDPYLRFKINDFVVKSKVATKTTSPVWNEELDIVATNPKSDNLVVELVDNDLNKNEVMCNPIIIPIAEHPYGDHYVYDDFIKLKKKNAGRLHFELDFSKVKERYIHTVQSSPPPAQVEQPEQVEPQPVEEKHEETVNEEHVVVAEPQPVVEDKHEEPVVEDKHDEPVVEDKHDELVVEDKHDEPVVEEEPAVVEPQPVDEEPKEPVNEEHVIEAPVQTRGILIEPKHEAPVDPCKITVNVVKGENILKLNDESAPYVTLQINDDGNSIQKTNTAENNENSVWDQSFDFHINNRDIDVLLINLYDKDEKLMNEISFPLKEWGVGTHIEYNTGIKLDEKETGKLYLQFDVAKEEPKPEQEQEQESSCSSEHKEVEKREGNKVFTIRGGNNLYKMGESVKGSIIGANRLPKTNSNGSDTYVVLTMIPPADLNRKPEKIKTSVAHDTQDPVWNKAFDFRYLQDGDLLRVEIFQSHKIVGDQCIACADIPLKCIEENKQVETTFKLDKPTKVPKALKKVTDFGTITLSLNHVVQYH